MCVPVGVTFEYPRGDFVPLRRFARTRGSIRWHRPVRRGTSAYTYTYTYTRLACTLLHVVSSHPPPQPAKRTRTRTATVTATATTRGGGSLTAPRDEPEPGIDEPEAGKSTSDAHRSHRWVGPCACACACACACRLRRTPRHRRVGCRAEGNGGRRAFRRRPSAALVRSGVFCSALRHEPQWCAGYSAFIRRWSSRHASAVVAHRSTGLSGSWPFCTCHLPSGQGRAPS